MRVTTPFQVSAFSLLRVQSIREKQWQASQDYFSFQSECKHTANQCHSEKTTRERGFERTFLGAALGTRSPGSPRPPSLPSGPFCSGKHHGQRWSEHEHFVGAAEGAAPSPALLSNDASNRNWQHRPTGSGSAQRLHLDAGSSGRGPAHAGLCFVSHSAWFERLEIALACQACQGLRL